MTTATRAKPSKLRGALLAYRIMAFTTGVVLLLGTITLIIQDAGHVNRIKTGVGLLWLTHGYLYLVYLVTTVNLGLKLRWGLGRMAAVALAGTIPTMSFVAEHFVTRDVRTRLAEAARPAA